ncbi:MAG: thioredoxin family protein [Terriglobales bacterium]
MATVTSKAETSKVVAPAEWLAARTEFLKKEKEFTRLRDELSRQRRELPWEKVEKQYWFDGPKGKETLADLFGGKGQLIVYHFMLGPGWKEGCPSCSYLADHFDGAAVHLAQRDSRLVVISRAPWPEIEVFKKRMGWQFKWVSSSGNDFNFDYHVSFSPAQKAEGKVFYNYEKTDFPSEEAPGASVFYKNKAGEIFHTYSSYARGLDILVGTYNFLDLTPKGRDEDGLARSMAWVRHHDKYSDGFVPASKIGAAEKERA